MWPCRSPKAVSGLASPFAARIHITDSPVRLGHEVRLSLDGFELRMAW